jgi:hypothetical protein
MLSALLNLILFMWLEFVDGRTQRLEGQIKHWSMYIIKLFKVKLVTFRCAQLLANGRLKHFD